MEDIMEDKEDAKIDIIGCGCWVFTHYWKDQQKYPAILLHGNKLRISRFFYEVYNRTWLPPGTVVYHTCNRPACINPDHLTLEKPKTEGTNDQT